MAEPQEIQDSRGFRTQLFRGAFGAAAIQEMDVSVIIIVGIAGKKTHGKHPAAKDYRVIQARATALQLYQAILLRHCCVVLGSSEGWPCRLPLRRLGSPLMPAGPPGPPPGPVQRECQRLVHGKANPAPAGPRRIAKSAPARVSDAEWRKRCPAHKVAIRQMHCAPGPAGAVRTQKVVIWHPKKPPQQATGGSPKQHQRAFQAPNGGNEYRLTRLIRQPRTGRGRTDAKGGHLAPKKPGPLAPH
eukprot:gene23074-biopygen10315